MAASGAAYQRAEQRTARGAAEQVALLRGWWRAARHLLRERDRIDAGGLLSPRLAFCGVRSLAFRALPPGGINDGLLRRCRNCQRRDRQADRKSNNSLHCEKPQKMLSNIRRPAYRRR
jgi:hypothetical protein